MKLFHFFSKSLYLTPSLATFCPHPSASPCLVSCPHTPLYNLSLPDCSIISPLWMADGSARWANRGQARAVVGVKYIEILFSIMYLLPFFSLPLSLFRCRVLNWKPVFENISKVAWFMESEFAWSSYGLLSCTPGFFFLGKGACTDLLSLQPNLFHKTFEADFILLWAHCLKEKLGKSASLKVTDVNRKHFRLFSFWTFFKDRYLLSW